MTLDQVKEYFGNPSEVTKALGLTRQAWTIWKKTGHVPILVQFTIQHMTAGKLRADIKDTNYLGRKKATEEKFVKITKEK